MTRWVLAALPLLPFVAGCVNEPRSQLLNSNAYQQPRLSTSRLPVQRDKANEAVAQRVHAVAQKVVLANPQAGLRPTFLAIGAPQAEVFHRGGGIHPWQVFVSSGLVEGCKTEAQLAAVLSLELGKIVAEREALASPAARRPTRLPAVDTPGNDTRASFGSPDATSFVEQVRFESKVVSPTQALPLPSPEALARGYLTKAGFPAAALAEVAPLLRQAENHSTFEKQLGDAAARQPSSVEMGRPIPAGPAAPPRQ